MNGPMDEKELTEKLRRIQALFAGATTEGERAAAAAAKDRVAARLRDVQAEAVSELCFTMTNTWSRRLLVALMRRHGVEPYRRRGQRHTTVMARLSRRLADELWREFTPLDDVLLKYFDDLAARVIAEAVHAGAQEVSEVEAGALADGQRARTG